MLSLQLQDHLLLPTKSRTICLPQIHFLELDTPTMADTYTPEKIINLSFHATLSDKLRLILLANDVSSITVATRPGRILDRSLSTAPYGISRAHISLNLEVPSLSAVYVLNFEPISLRAFCVKEPQLGCIDSALPLVGHVWKQMMIVPNNT